MTGSAPHARENEGSAELTIYVQPRASKTEFAGTHNGMLKLRVAAPPVDNSANTAAVQFFAHLLGIPKSRVRIVFGEKSREKRLRFEGLSLQQLKLRLP